MYLHLFKVRGYSFIMRTESKSLKETLEPILGILNDLGGKFTFLDDDGNKFILASEEALEAEQEETTYEIEQQLSLPQADTVSRAIRKHVDSSIQDDVLERINRDIALAYAVEQEAGEELDEIEEIAVTPDYPQPPRIRFEPLRGDLPPDLQE